MKQRRAKVKYKADKSNNDIIVVALGLIILACIFLHGCSSAQIVKINVPTPCEVKEVPKEPKAIDLQNSSISVVMAYIKDIIQYAKEVKPILNKCVKENNIAETK